PRPPIPALFPYTTLFRSRALQPAGVLLRKEPLRYHRKQVAVHCDGQDGHGKDAAGMTQHPRETRLVAAPHPLEGPLARPVEAAVDRKSTRLNSSHVAISY